MDDEKIVNLYWQRDERAIVETAEKYGAYCRKISMNILGDPLDSEENVNDTYINSWNSMPPHKPARLPAFIGKITRNLALNRYKAQHTQKRFASEFALSLDELDECAASVRAPDTTESEAEVGLIRDALNAFLEGQEKTARSIFVSRYFYCESVEEIARRFGCTSGKVKSILFRMRNKLRLHLESEGITV